MYITIEFICKRSEFVHEFMTLWIHILNSYYYQMWIHESDFTWIWFRDTSSLLKIEENSIFWIHDIEFSREICYMNSFLWICKKFNSDFPYEFINGLNLYEFMDLNSQENWWLHTCSTPKQLNPIHLNTSKPYSSFKVSIALGEREYCCVFHKTNEFVKSWHQ